MSLQLPQLSDAPQERSALAGFPKIQDYAAIGDCRAAALVSREGAIEWLCWPRFDSPSMFAAILDRERGGHWSITPAGPFRVRRRYVPESNVLETCFHCPDGAAVLTDLMPVASEQFRRSVLLADHELLRQVECTSGEVLLRCDFYPREGYGRRPLRIREMGKLGYMMEINDGGCWLRGTHPLRLTADRLRGEIRLRAGERAQFSLVYGEESPLVLPPFGDWTQQRIRASNAWWQQWARRAEYRGPYREALVRSALALKLLTYAPSGAIIAAITTSLPERIGGDLNWDYRYCWLRDAALTVRALLGLGYREEAEAFLNWLLHATALTRPQLRILYTVFGENAPTERCLEHLTGYCHSRPVRIGNAARQQLQLDVYGEVIDAAAQYQFSGGAFDHPTQKVLLELGHYVTRNWRQPDDGIWEPRVARAHHTHSRVLCWTALDRLIRFAEQGVVQGAPVDELRRERRAIFHDVKEHGWNPRLRAYTSTLGGDDLDASLLLLAWYGFEEAHSVRMRATHHAIRRRLSAPNGLLYRYLAQPEEGAFGICGFWEVEYLALGGGPLHQARARFERLLQCQNDVGLFAEENDGANGDALGNFPQGFTHLGLISAALSLQEVDEGQKHLPHRPQSAEQAQQGEQP
jgi:GH15 family glucan-1,4-alpha-glucosidase